MALHSGAVPGGASTDAMGVGFMILSEALLAMVNAIVKFVQAWPAARILAARCVVDLLLSLGVWAALRLAKPSLADAGRLLLRAAAYCAFMACLWGGLRSCLPLGDIVVVVVALSPVFLVALTRLLLGEVIPSSWPLQLALCVAGALLVSKPMSADPSCPAATALLPLGAAFFGALMNFMSRNLKGVPPPVVMAFNDVVALLFACGATALGSGAHGPGTSLLPSTLDRNCGLVLLAAVIGWFGLMSNVRGYQSVSVAAVASIAGYSSVPLGYALQVLVFGDVPDAWSAVGATLILCTNVGASWSKYQAVKAEKAAKIQDGYEPLPAGEAPAEALGA